MAYTIYDSNDSLQHEAPYSKQSKVFFYKLYCTGQEINDIDIGRAKRIGTRIKQQHIITYAILQQCTRTVYMHTGSSGTKAAGIIGPTRYWRLL